MSATAEQTKTIYYSVTDTAKMIRKTLKAAFPGTKFSVRCSKYSGGASIDVRWIDGPTRNQVDAVIGFYQGSKFDAMIDLKSYVTQEVVLADGSKARVHYGSDYVHTARDLSDAELAKYEQIVRERYGLKQNPADPFERVDGRWSFYELVRHASEHERSFAYLANN